MKRRKTKLWKKVLVGFMSFTMFLGNLSSLSIEAFAATEDALYDDEDGGITDPDSLIEPESEDIDAGDEHYEDMPEDVAVYSVTYYDVDGSLLGSSEFAEGSGLDFPEASDNAYWTDADGIEYFAGDAVYEDLSLFVNVDDIDIEDEAEDEDEEIAEDQILVYAYLVDTKGDALDSFRVTSDMYLAADDDNDAPAIDDYAFAYAQIDASVITEVLVDETDDGLLVYTVDGTALEADADIELVYESTVFDYEISLEVVDEDGDLIAGYEDAALPEFDALDLADAANAPLEIEGYEYIGATIAGGTISSIYKEDGKAYYEDDLGAVEIDSDILITLTYAETSVATVLTATIVDEFGDEIDDEYTDMELPEFDEDGVLVLDDPELPPVEDVKVRSGLFRTIKYTYVKATINNRIVTAIKAEDAETGTYYSYTTDGETWTKLKEDTTVLFEYTDGKKTTYTYEDDYVSVTATLQHANAVPDDAYFAVTPLTAGSGYDVDTYIDALNAKADTPDDSDNFEYTVANTLLYDIAFYTDETMSEEIEPADGMVKTEIVFLQNQLKDDLAASDKSDLLINHLSLDEGVVEEAGTTANANVTVNTLNVETIAADVSVAAESVAFTTEGYSVFAITDPAVQSAQIVIEYDIAPSSIPYGFIYIYDFYSDNQNKRALLYLDNLNISDNKIVIDNDTLEGTLLGSLEADKTYGIELWRAVSPTKVETLKKNTQATFENNDFIKIVYDAYTNEYISGRQYFTGKYYDWGGEIWETEAGRVETTFTKTQTEGLLDMYTYTMPAAGEMVDGVYTIRISATQAPVSKFIDAPTALGEASNYGVIADTYKNVADTQTNFATNHYIGGDATGADLSNNPGTTYIGKVTPTKERGVQVRDNLGASTIYYGGTLTQTSNGNEKDYYDTDGNLVIQDDSGKATVISVPYGTVSDKVSDLIDGVRIPQGTSSIVLPKTAPVNEQEYYLDTTMLPDGNIHIDLDDSTGDGGSSLYDIWSTTQKVYIKKNPGQTLVFHSSKTDITLCEFNAWREDIQKYDTVASPKSNAEDKNKNTAFLADLASTLIFDFPNATNLTFASSVAGAFYAPNAHVSWKTACCGWLICDYAEGADGEWHFIYQHVSEETPEIPEPETTEISVTKVWSDIDTNAHTNDKVTVQLTRKEGDEYVDVEGKILELPVDNSWSGKFENLPAKDGETNIIYGVREATVNGVTIEKGTTSVIIDDDTTYNIAVTGNATSGFTVTNTPGGKGQLWIRKRANLGFSNYTTLINKIKLEVWDADENVLVKEATHNGNNSWDFYVDDLEYGRSYYIVEKDYSMDGKALVATYMYPVSDEFEDEEYYYSTATGSFEISELGAATQETGKSSKFIFTETKDHVYLFNMYSYSGTLRIHKMVVNNFGSDAVRDADSSFLNNVWFRLTNQSTGNYIVFKGFTGHAKIDTSEARGHNPDGSPDGLTYLVEYNENAQWTLYDLPAGTYLVEEVGDGHTFTYDEASNTITDIYDANYRRVTHYAVTTDVEYDSTTYSKLADNKRNQRAMDNGQNEKPMTAVVGDSSVANTTHTQTVQVCNFYSNPVAPVYAAKSYTGWDDNTDPDRTFTFEISAGSNNAANSAGGSISTPMPAVRTATATKDEPIVSFGSILYDHEGTYYYTIREQIPDGAERVTTANGVGYLFDGVIYDPRVIDVAVTVKQVKASFYKKYSNTPIYEETFYYLAADVVYTDDETVIATSELRLVEEPRAKTTTNTNSEETNVDTTTNTVSEDTGVDTTINTDSELTKVDTTSRLDNFAATWTWANEERQAMFFNTSQELINVSGSKTWDDKNNQDGARPESITITLLANGENAGVESKTVTATEGWEWTFENLPKYDNDGKEITYSVSEAAVTGYTSTVNGMDVINTHNPDTTEINVSKVWTGDLDNTQFRKPITVNLIANGDTEHPVRTNVLNETNLWKCEFAELPVYSGGTKIVYTVEEISVDKYTSVITGDAETGFVITNTYQPEYVQISGTKVWVDENNFDESRPAGVTIHLAANGDEIATKTVTGSKDINTWNWDFNDITLKKYANGVEIAYTVSEDPVTNYSTNITQISPDADGHYDYSAGIEITNTHTPGKTAVSVTKSWVDDSDRDGKRPASVEVELIKTVGSTTSVYDTQTLSEANGWTYTWDNLAATQNNAPASYSVHEKSEDPVTHKTPEGYDVSYNGYNITNTYTPETVTIKGIKDWADNNDQDGIRGSVVIGLYKNGVRIKGTDATEADNWAWSFENLPKYENKSLINYTVKEETALTGYTVDHEELHVVLTADTKVVDGLVFTNTHTPYTVNITGTKHWADDDDQDGIRPTTISIQLLANGSELKDQVAIVKPDSNGDWDFAFYGLPKKANGQNIIYTIKEVSVPAGYSVSYVQPDIEKNDYTCSVTNTHKSDEINIKGTKTWVDNYNQDGKRPDSITVNLLANGTLKQTATVEADADGKWSYEFTGLAKNASGQEIKYSITEDAVDGYATTINGYNITNTHEPEKITISGSKTWDDAGNQDGKRPASIKLELYANNVKVKEITTSKDNNWAWNFDNLDKYADGKKIAYTVKEAAVQDYTTDPKNGFDATSADPNIADNLTGLVFTNTHTPDKTRIGVVKAWNDEDNRDNKRPESVTVNLLANGQKVDGVTLDASNSWTHIFTGLDKYAGGEEIAYSISEEDVDGYTASYSDKNIDGVLTTTITNTYAPGTTYVSGTKVWHDGENQDGSRPKSVTINLYADGKYLKSATASEVSNWTWRFDDLPEYEAGKVGHKIEYTVDETPVAGYTTSIDLVEGKTNEYTVTNTHNPATISVSGSKKWEDANNQDGIRPSSITVKLNADNVQVDERTTTANAPNYEWRFDDLPKFSDGVEIVYVATEVLPENSGYTLTGTSKCAVNPNTGDISGIVFTNEHTPATVTISGIKEWDDNNDQDGIRPTEISVQLYADGTAKGQPQVVEADKDGNWNFSFTDLPRYNGGTRINYTVEEILPADSDYKLDSSQSFAGTYDEATGDTTGIIFTNKHNPATVNISGIKKWDDANNQDGKRPESVTIILYKTVNGSTTKVTKTTASQATNWEWSFTNQPKYEAKALIDYDVEEVPVNVAGYSGAMTSDGKADSAGNTTDVVFTNSYTPEPTSVSGTKVWDDNHDQDGKRPESITLNLYQNGSDTVFRTLTLKPDDKSADTWDWSFNDLPKYSEGKLITYRVEEVAVTGYNAPEYSADGKTITNKRVPETTEVSGIKVWDDVDDQDGKRPASVTIRLLADNTEVDNRTLTAATGWEFRFTDLPKYSNGSEIAYTVSEDKVSDYSTVIKGSTSSEHPYYTVTNSYTPGKIAVSGTKVWSDNDNQDGIRPTEITVRLLADGKEVDSVIARSANGYAWSFTGLDEYKAGNPIEYTVTEDEVAGYKTEITGKDNVWTITNTHEPDKTSVSGTKTWADNNDQDGVRPASITVNLLANGTKVQSTPVTPDESGKWAYEFNDLDKKQGGKDIEYTVTEDAISIKTGHNNSYTVSVDGYNITNTYIPETVEISGSKTWDDADDQDGVRPTSITIYLKAGGDISQTLEVPVAEDGTANWEFKDLPKYKNGEKIVYTIDEAPITNDSGELLYDKTVSGYDVVNTHKPEVIDIAGSKTWDDANNNDNIRPDAIEIQLLANGEPVDGQKVIVTADDNWSWIFKDQPVFNSGSAIIYSVSETPIDGYETLPVEGAGTYDHTVINKHEREYVGLTVNKHWFGADAQAAADSVQISVEGIANGSVVVPAKTATISAPDWTYSVKAEDKILPKFYKGEEIRYYVTEIVPADAKYIQVDANGAKYSQPTLATGDALTADIWNMALTEITVIKQWIDDPGYHGGQDFVEVTLLADGAVYKTVQIKETDDWQYTFTGLPVYNAAKDKIAYTVVENTLLSEYNSENGGKPVIDYSQAGQIKIQNVLDPLTLTVNKQWLGDPEGTVHSDITVNIMSSVDTKGTATSVTDRIKKVLGIDSDKWYLYTTVTLGNANDWTTTVENLPRYWKVGNDVVKVSYAVEEVDVPEGYTSVANVDGSTATIINTGYTSVAGFKTWDDGSNVVGYRPGSAEFAALIGLFENGSTDPVYRGNNAEHFRWLDTSGDTWSFEFYDLPAGKDYVIGELARVLGYGEPTIDGYTIKNPLEFTERTVTKIWDDENNVYASRPASIAFRLLANGAQVSIAGVTPVVTLDNTNGATYTWKNLPVNDRNGNKIAYTIEEVSVPAGYTATARVDGNTTTITNTYRPDETQLTVYKVWDDDNDAAGIRPVSIQVALTRNGSDVEMVTLSAANGWTYTWSGLSTVLADGSGATAVYGVREVSQILGYTVTVTGSGEAYTITNYYRAPDTPPRTPGEEIPDEETPTGSRIPTQSPYTIPDEPTPLAGLSQVLGARRAPAGSVLGARRSPQTGDASNVAAFAAAMASAGAMMGAWFAMRKKKK